MAELDDIVANYLGSDDSWTMSDVFTIIGLLDKILVSIPKARRYTITLAEVVDSFARYANTNG